MPANLITWPHFSVSSTIQLAELVRRSRQRRAAEVGEARPHLGVGEAGIDLLIELVAMMSSAPPGAKPTMMRTGRLRSQSRHDAREIPASPRSRSPFDDYNSRSDACLGIRVLSLKSDGLVEILGIERRGLLLLVSYDEVWHLIIFSFSELHRRAYSTVSTLVADWPTRFPISCIRRG